MANSNTGKVFEDDFRSSIDKDRCLLIRLNDQPQVFAKTAKFSLKPPCDFVLYDSMTKLLVPLEFKTTKYKSMSYEDINEKIYDEFFGKEEENENNNRNS